MALKQLEMTDSECRSFEEGKAPQKKKAIIIVISSVRKVEKKRRKRK